MESATTSAVADERPSAKTDGSAARLRLDRHELAGAFADIGVLVPIATALMIKNELSATAVFLPAGLLYLMAAFVFRVPMPVQPLKAFGAIAIAKGLGSDEIAAGALIMGIVFLVLGRVGLIDAAARVFPKALIRGVQLTVGLLFLKIAWGLVADAPKSFLDHTADPKLLVVLAAVVLFAAIALRRRSVTLVLVAVAVVVAVVRSSGDLAIGPSAIELPHFDATTFWTAFTVLALPQIPLTFANSCVATSDAAHVYFGERARRVLPGRLAITLGLANLFSGAIGGMPVCHGAGGLTAHYSFGARTMAAPIAIGATLLVLAIGFGTCLAAVFSAFPLAILAGMLAAAGIMHIGLLKDLHGKRDWALALLVGVIGFQINLALALVVGLALAWLPALVARVRGGGSTAT